LARVLGNLAILTIPRFWGFPKKEGRTRVPKANFGAIFWGKPGEIGLGGLAWGN